MRSHPEAHSLAGVSSVLGRFYDRVRHREAFSVGKQQSTVDGFEHFKDHKYCVLVTYKRSGEFVPTPVWFGLSNGALYVRSEASAAKVRRIRNDSRVRVAPCTARGRPLGPPAEGRARVLQGPAEEQRAEVALQANYGSGRRLYKATATVLRAATAYLEIVASEPPR